MTGSVGNPFSNPMKRRTFFGIAGGASGVALLSACGMESEGGGDGGDGEGEAITLRAAFDRPFLDLNPFGPTNVEQSTLLVASLLYDSLVVRQEDEIVPSLATEWTQSDELTWVFTLGDATFHDGNPVTAEDVKASIENIAQGETPQAPLWADLDSIEATDEKTVTIRTTAPLGTILANLSIISVLPQDSVGDAAAFASDPPGSGAFKVTSFTASDHLNVEAYPDYWAGAAASPAIEFPYIPEVSTRMTALTAGEVHLAWSIPPDQLDQMTQQEGMTVESIPSTINYFNWFNSSREPFTDVRVRRAMWMALDIESTVSDLFGDSAEVATAPIPSSVFGYSAQEPYPYNPDQARQLLEEAGVGEGFSTHLMWAQGVAPQIRPLAETFASYWREIGVTVELQELEQAVWLERLLALDWDMEIQNAGSNTGDADYTLGRLYTTDANRMGYSNPELDGILAEARATTDQDQRAELYADACKIIWDDAVGVFPLQMLATYGVRDGVEGFVPSPDNRPDFAPIHTA